MTSTPPPQTAMDAEHQRAFRRALGSFATGVTIATTLDASDRPVGVTASSFNSVSLNPPLVLWSLAKNSQSRDAFANSGHFAVHVLAASQEALSNRFAKTGEDKFGGMDWAGGKLGSPVFTEHAALFECATRHQYDGGDHIIMVGEVVDFEARDEAPLLFHAGRYADHRPRDGSRDGSSDTSDAETQAQRLSLAAGTVAQALESIPADGLSADDIAAARRVLGQLIDVRPG